MQIDYIRRDTPEEISENGGAFIVLVNKDTLGLSTSIDEAKSSLYVVGSNSMIEGYFVGLMRSVFEGIKDDGHPRTIGDITIFPVCGGTFDLDKGWDPLVNDVRIKARLGNGITLDISDWTFRDVTEGRVAYTIETVSDGTVTGQVSTNANVELNGRNFPATSLLTVTWVCGTKSGTVDATKLSGNIARLTIDKSALSTLTSDDDGKEIVLTVKGCYNKVTKTAIVRYVGSEISKVYSTGHESEADKIYDAVNFNVAGTSLNKAAELHLRYYDTEGGDHVLEFGAESAVSKSDTLWVYKGESLYETMETNCQESGKTFDKSRGGRIELISSALLAVATKVVTFNA